MKHLFLIFLSYPHKGLGLFPSQSDKDSQETECVVKGAEIHCDLDNLISACKAQDVSEAFSSWGPFLSSPSLPFFSIFFCWAFSFHKLKMSFLKFISHAYTFIYTILFHAHIYIYHTTLTRVLSAHISFNARLLFLWVIRRRRSSRHVKLMTLISSFLVVGISHLFSGARMVYILSIYIYIYIWDVYFMWAGLTDEFSWNFSLSHHPFLSHSLASSYSLSLSLTHSLSLSLSLSLTRPSLFNFTISSFLSIYLAWSGQQNISTALCRVLRHLKGMDQGNSGFLCLKHQPIFYSFSLTFHHLYYV